MDEFKGVDLLLIGGLPASGKTVLATTIFRERYRINRDEIRAFRFQMTTGKTFTSKDFDYNAEGVITQIEDLLLENALGTNKRIVVDNTLMSVHRRRKYVELAKKYGRSVGCLFLDTPFQVCLQRNKLRTTMEVPRKIMEDLYAAKELPTLAEGFEKLKVV